jgi:hypothetical protein
VFVLWRDLLTPSGELLFSRSDDLGWNFSPGIGVSNSEGSSARAELAADRGGTIYLVWDQNGHVAFSKSTDAGTTFTPPAALTEATTYAGEATVAARRAGEVVAAWTELVEDRLQVVLARSQDEGITFSEPHILSDSPEDATTPRIWLRRDGTILVVHGQQDGSGIQHLVFRPTHVHALLLQERLLPRVRVLGVGAEADLHADEEGRIYVVWNQDGEIFFSHSEDDGWTFSTPENLSQTPGLALPDAPGYSGKPSVAVNAAGDVFVAWQEVLVDPDTGIVNQEVVLTRALREEGT